MSTQECNKKILMLERRLSRERISRKTAEEILENRSRELYELNQALVDANHDLEKLTTAVEQSPTMVVITDLGGKVEYVNHSFCAVSGYEKTDVIDKDIRILKISNAEETREAIDDVMQNHQVWKGILWNKKKNNDDFLVSLTISPILNNQGSISHYLYNSEDITQQKNYEDKIHQLAHHDPLTGLFNRYSLEDRLSQALNQASRSNDKIGILFLDLDRFKTINDTLGHKAGDEILKQVANRLMAICRRKSDIIARIGGDEFVAVLTEMTDISFAALTAKAIVEVLSIPYEFEGQLLRTSPSIGISVFPDDGQKADELLKGADMAMYHVKEDGRNNFSFFTDEMNQRISEKLRLEKDLRDTLDNNELELHYQPQICSKTNRVYGVEALIRWNHKELGFISPEKFILIAEETGQIYDLGLWVLDTAFAQLKQWIEKGINDVRVAINISALQLANDNFVSDIEFRCSHAQIDPAMIELEVTESAAMEDPESSIAKLKEIRKLGFELAIDDFGTGYSSLAYLKMLPIQTLKLDRAFVNNLENDENNAAISKASISLGHDLGFKIVAEGIETKAQETYLKENQCDILQGYYLSRPLTADKAEQFILQINKP